MRSSFTLIELLVVIAIVAILSAVVIITLNPAELLKQSRDSNRLSDLDILARAVALAETEGKELGNASTTYFSIADPAATSTTATDCAGLGLGSAPSGWSYQCAASSTLRNVDGTGWVPVNFSSLSYGSPLGSLPIDPTNTTSSGYYYTYTPGGSFEVNVFMESAKYRQGGSRDAVTGDGGDFQGAVEKGSNLNLGLFSDTRGLEGWWKFEEGSGTSTADASGNGYTGTLTSGPTWTTGKVGTGAINFAGATNYVLVGTSGAGPFADIGTGNFTISAWATNISGPAYRWITSNWDGSGGHHFGMNSNGKFGGYPAGGTEVSSDYTLTSDGSWHYLVVTRSAAGTITYYVDGASQGGSTGLTASLIRTGDTRIGARGDGGQVWSGVIDDVRVYNRALSLPEIQAIYNASR